MAYDFHYTPTGTGVISGKEVLEQTEDAINDLGNTAISGVQEALDKAEQALTNSENAVDDAQTALNTANNAEGVAIQAQTDVGNLSGTVTNIGNRVTTAEGNISNLQGRMTTAEGNITNIQGRMTTAETNIGNLQTAVSTAQATANSAQQTATTARQQSYVFRYSSTALVASSTNSNTLLDNTDNLKVGDKVIDSSGVLFSITAIDTANSTFTVGSALVDLALDANVVHTSGDETIGGKKTFSENITCFSNSDAKSIICKTPLSTYDSTNTVGDNTKIRFLDKNNNSISYIMQRKLTNGNTDLSLNISNTDSNNQPIEATLNFILDSANEPRLSPGIDNTISLGRPTFRWKSVYATNYYYGSNNVEFSTKFVTTDTAQTISGAKTFSSDITLQGTTTPVIKTISNIVQDSTGGNGSVSWVIRDKDDLNNILESALYKYSAKSIDWQLKLTGIDNGVSNTKGIRFTLDPVNDVANFIPIGNNNTSLGNSSTKWKDVQTKLINGLTPSSLSLPATTGIVDISGYVTDLTGGNVNNYTPLANGYIVITCNSNDVDYIKMSNNLDFVSVVDNTNNQFTSGILGVWQPCVAGIGVQIRIKASALNSAKFIPCQGNV